MRLAHTDDANHVKAELAAFVEGLLRLAMRKVCAHADIVIHVIGEVQGLLPISQSEARDIVFELTGAHEADLVSFGPEAGLFQSIGMSAVICGPGSIAQAHKPNKYIEIAQLDTYLRILEKLRSTILH